MKNAPYIKDYPISGVKIPSLSELVEACPKIIKNHNGDLFLFSLDWGSNWQAGYSWYDEEYEQHGLGSTPEEAVANLWLALNKKN
jgi:hypothetical protein